jgi:hypothetical protein
MSGLGGQPELGAEVGEETLQRFTTQLFLQRPRSAGHEVGSRFGTQDAVNRLLEQTQGIELGRADLDAHSLRDQSRDELSCGAEALQPELAGAARERAQPAADAIRNEEAHGAGPSRAARLPNRS